MSYLHPVRLAFAGLFQADVSTVNNDVRHFDNSTFEPAFQQFQTATSWNGWWNPTGSGAFRLVECRVTGVWYGDGTSAHSPTDDPVVGMVVAGSSGRTAGKLVDIDPQWQLASAPWGLEVRLVDGSGQEAVGGGFKPNAFRDLWFTRRPSKGGDSAASSTFQSVLDGVRWGDGLDSRFLRELHAASPDELSIRLTTFGYVDGVTDPLFTLGTVIGSLGPQLPGEPESFVRGRRFVPANGPASWNGITYFSGVVDGASATLLLDLSNALQISDRQGTPLDIGPMAVGVLQDPAVAEQQPVTPESFVPVAEVPYADDGWLAANGGVFSAPLSEQQLALAAEHPLALVVAAPVASDGWTPWSAGGALLAIKEPASGLLVEAEPQVHRVDAPGKTQVTFHVSRFGAPVVGARITVTQTGRMENQGGGQMDGATAPQAAIPDIGVPEDALTLPADLVTDAAGVAVGVVAAVDPDNPRGYIDGQLYLLDFAVAGEDNPPRQTFDYVVLHVRDAVAPVSSPTWADVAPILQQYANLYPLMDTQVVNLASETAVAANRDLVRLAFSLDERDPNYMPATRDLSAGKRDLILRWLDGLAAPEAGAAGGAGTAGGPGAGGPGGLRGSPPPRSNLRRAAASDADAEAVSVDSKKVFAENFVRTLRREQ